MWPITSIRLSLQEREGTSAGFRRMWIIAYVMLAHGTGRPPNVWGKGRRRERRVQTVRPRREPSACSETVILADFAAMKVNRSVLQFNPVWLHPAASRVPPLLIVDIPPPAPTFSVHTGSILQALKSQSSITTTIRTLSLCIVYSCGNIREHVEITEKQSLWRNKRVLLWVNERTSRQTKGGRI